MPQPSGAFDPGIIQIVVAIVGLLGVCGVAAINRLGTKRSKLNEQVSEFIDDLKEDNAALRAEIKELRAELRQCEQLRREDFEGVIRQYFPEFKPKEIGPDE